MIPCPRCHLAYASRGVLAEHLHVDHYQSRPAAAREADEAIAEASRRAGLPASAAPEPAPAPTPAEPAPIAPAPAEAPQTQEDPMPVGVYDRSKIICKRCGQSGHASCKGDAVKSKRQGTSKPAAKSARTATPPAPTNGQPATVPVGTVALLRARIAELRADADALERALTILGGAA